MKRRTVAAVLAAALLVAYVAGCSPKAETTDTAKPAAQTVAIRIGTLPTEDMLPLWVAEQAGMFGEAGLTDVKIETFQSAQERDAAMAAGSIDAFMGDLLAAASLEAAGTSVTVPFVMLGQTADEGRFGIVAAPGSDVTTLTQLAGVPVGTSSNTIQEYVLDGLMRQAGVAADQIKKEEVKKVPVRFDLLMNGKIAAAALPEPFLTLAEKQGAKLLADDTTGENLSQTVMVVRDDFIRRTGGIETVAALMDAWDLGAQAVDAEPNKYRALLVDKARLPEPIKDTYQIEQYPMAGAPTQEMVDPVLAWMNAKGLLKKPVTFQDLAIVTP